MRGISLPGTDYLGKTCWTIINKSPMLSGYWTQSMWQRTWGAASLSDRGVSLNTSWG